MTNSHDLLTEYVRNGSESAFREIVARYVDLVYSVARRLVDGDAHRAEDVAQMVFADLAKVAPGLSPEVMLGGWLHRHTCFVASKIMRGERRRQLRERQAVEMSSLHNSSETDFQLIAPILDEAINKLGDADRIAIVLRFFQRCDFRSVGEALGSNEDAARMRVNRALRKLQALLKRRGVRNSAGALALALTANSVQAAPAGLALAITTTVRLAGTVASGSAAAAVSKTAAVATLKGVGAVTFLAVAIGAGIFQVREGTQPPRGASDRVVMGSEPMRAQIVSTEAGGPGASVVQEGEAGESAVPLPALGGKKPYGKDIFAGLAWMQATLNLNVEQTEKVRQIVIGGMNAEPGFAPDLAGELVSEGAESCRVEGESMTRRIKALLTTEQREAYDHYQMEGLFDCPDGAGTAVTA